MSKTIQTGLRFSCELKAAVARFAMMDEVGENAQRGATDGDTFTAAVERLVALGLTCVMQDDLHHRVDLSSFESRWTGQDGTVYITSLRGQSTPNIARAALEWMAYRDGYEGVNFAPSDDGIRYLASDPSLSHRYTNDVIGGVVAEQMENSQRKRRRGLSAN